MRRYETKRLNGESDRSARTVKKMKILVTGSAGFIGYHLSDLLLTAGHEVLVQTITLLIATCRSN